MTSKVSAVEMKSAKSNVIIKAFQIYTRIAMQREVYWIYVQLCNHGGVKESLCTPRTIMVEFAILALAVGKRTRPLVGVRYIYLRKNVDLWWRVTS